MSDLIHVTRAGVLTVETQDPHGYRQGQTIVITAEGKPDRWLVTQVHDPKKFSAIQDKRTRKQRRRAISEERKKQ